MVSPGHTPSLPLGSTNEFCGDKVFCGAGEEGLKMALQEHGDQMQDGE